LKPVVANHAVTIALKALLRLVSGRSHKRTFFVISLPYKARDRVARGSNRALTIKITDPRTIVPLGV